MDRIEQVRALVREMEARVEKIRHSTTIPPETERKRSDS